MTASLGDALNFGAAVLGDTLTFVLKNITLGMSAYSDPSLNGGYDSVGQNLHNHIYSTDYTGTGPVFPGVPVGTYVAFEDLPFPGADFNYDDESFVFSNVKGTSVPEPAALLLFGAGLSILAMRIRRAKASPSAR